MTDGGVQVVEERFADVIVVSVCGRLDQETSFGFQAQILDAIAKTDLQPPRVALDLSDLDYISSIGLRTLLIAAKQCQAGNGQLAVAALTPTVQEILEISRFDQIIDCNEDLRSALAVLSDQGLEAYDRSRDRALC